MNNIGNKAMVGYMLSEILELGETMPENIKDYFVKIIEEDIKQVEADILMDTLNVLKRCESENNDFKQDNNSESE